MTMESILLPGKIDLGFDAPLTQGYPRLPCDVRAAQSLRCACLLRRVRLYASPCPGAYLPALRFAMQHERHLRFLLNGIAVLLVEVHRRNDDVSQVPFDLCARRIAVLHDAVCNARRLRMLCVGLRPGVRRTRSRPDMRGELVSDADTAAGIRGVAGFGVTLVETIDELMNGRGDVVARSRQRGQPHEAREQQADQCLFQGHYSR